MSSLQLITLPEPLRCSGVLYTAHDGTREADNALDIVKAEWALNQGACFLRVNIDIPVRISGATAPPDVVTAWRQRTPNNPIVLVDRYKGGLMLAAMINHGLITKHDGVSHPWIFYADGDVGMTNMKRSIENLVRDAIHASHLPTLEERTLEDRVRETANITLAGDLTTLKNQPAPIQSLTRKLVTDYRFVGNMPDAPAHRNLHMLFPHGDCLLPRSFVQTGTILFKPSRLSGYVLEVLANSPYYAIDTGSFAMGDQAIMDWLLTNSFGVRWSTHTKVHCRSSDFTRTCRELSELTYMTRVNKPSANGRSHRYVEETIELEDASWFEDDFEDDTLSAQAFGAPLPSGRKLLERYWSLWQPDQNSYIATTCSRWTNSPICNIRRRRGEASPFHYRCGDVLFHMYGCKKSELFSQELHDLLLQDARCQGILPESLIQLISRR